MVRPTTLGLLLAAFALGGCTGDGGVDCDTSAAVSVSVTVVDPDGVFVDDVTVTYTREDSEEAETCDEGPDVFLCGYEVSGTLTIRAEAQGYSPYETEVTVTEGECHVDGESVEIIMQPVDCPQVELPSVHVTIVDTDGETIEGAWAEYAPECEDWFAPQECDDLGDGSFYCGWGFTCPLYIDAYADGYQPDFAIVDPDEDECGPILTPYEFVLEVQ